METKASVVDSWASQINGIPLNVHFYIMDLAHSGSAGINFAPFNISGQVINMLYMPFLEWNDLGNDVIRTIPFDQKYYGTVKPDAIGPDDYAKECNVFKIYGTHNIQYKQLGTFKRYPAFGRQTGQRHWTNESKIYQFPYHFCTINDYINTPLLIKNEYLTQTGDDVGVRVYQPITMTGSYTIFVDGYKGDMSPIGANEGMLSSGGLDLPTSSSEYAQFMATSKSQYLTQQESANRKITTGLATSLGTMGMGIIQTALTGGTNLMGWGMIGAGAMGMVNTLVDDHNRIEQANAKMDDMMNAPRSVFMSSSDILSSMTRNNKKVIVNRYLPTPYYKEKLTNFWHLYGYKQNKLMTPDTKSRKYWNFIKTINAKIKSNAMDKNEIEMVKKIYDNGIRFWHQQNGEMHNYEKDNVEV